LKKSALVIGNGDYQNTDRLKNPLNDSRDIKNSLEKLGFEVIYGENLTKKEITRKLNQFGESAINSETALFYFAGHGLQENGENYLIPVDAEIRKSADIPEESYSFSRIEKEFADLGNSSNIFILDACRDNPFENQMKSFANSRNIAFNSSRGLANPNMFIGNSVIAYSTSPNDIALDNPNENNGVYTKYLKDMILEAGTSFESILKKVARAVKQETGNRQQPWVHSNSDRDIFLNGEQSDGSKVIYRDRVVYQDRVKVIKEESFSKTDKPKNVFRNYILASLLIGGGVFGYWQYSKIEKQRVVKAISKWSDEFGLGLPKTWEELSKVEGISAVGKYADIKEKFAKREENKGKNLDNYYFADTEKKKITYIPEEIGNLSNLQKLVLSYNKLTSLPSEIGNLSNLQKLVLSYNKLTSLPSEIGNLSNLQYLSLWENELTSLPSEIGNLSNLQTLWLEDNQLTSLPSEIGNLSNLQYLSLNHNELRSFPSWIGNLSNLQTLWLNGNRLTSLPSEIGNLSNLQELDLGNNQLTSLPSEIGNLSNLQELWLNGNRLTSLPSEIGNLSNLQKLVLWENELTSLPSSVNRLTKLKIETQRNSRFIWLTEN
jgi:leucine-rich repeat protein SHOC2